MGNVLRIGDGSTDVFAGGLASFRQRIVSGIKELPVFLHLRQHILVGGKLAIQTKELLLLFGQSTDVDLVAPGWEHV